jgi:cytochrome c-type biogenesis protein CcmH
VRDVVRRSLGWIIPLAALVVIVVGLLPRTGVADPATRVQQVASGIRCPFCSGESLADSTSDVARDLRDIIAEQVADGMSNAEIADYFAARYGDQILLDPSRRGWGLALWLIPVAAVAVGVVAIARRRRKREPS